MSCKRMSIFTIWIQTPQLLLQESYTKHVWRIVTTYFGSLHINNPKYKVKLTKLWVENDKMDLTTLIRSLYLYPNEIPRFYHWSKSQPIYQEWCTITSNILRYTPNIKAFTVFILKMRSSLKWSFYAGIVLCSLG